ncbi:MAG: hypothetical protein GF308_22385 [Candidatus Heimdallarchaeota archaeon]|nr:hypothetical protein [Candidatus Heimdallarchaeota archaeon]
MMKKIWTIISVIVLILIIGGIGIGIFYYFTREPEVQLYLAIHCEPGAVPSSLDQPETYWPFLKTMVTKADQYGIKLNLLFNPQWAHYILQNTSRFFMIRNWEANGHEIGVHHHGPHHGGWNGYTNQVDYQGDPRYLGNISDMMIPLNQLPASGQIVSGCISTQDDIEYDCPEGLLYTTYGGGDKLDHLWSFPDYGYYNDQTVLRVTHALFGSEKNEVVIDLDQFKELYQEKNNEFVMGLVWHAFNYAENPSTYIDFFSYLQQEGIQTHTLPEILGNMTIYY